MASVEVYQSRPTEDDTRMSMPIQIRSISVSSKTNPSVDKRSELNANRFDEINGFEGRSRTKRVPSLSLKVKAVESTSSPSWLADLTGRESPSSKVARALTEPPSSPASSPSVAVKSYGSPHTQKSSSQPPEENRPHSPLAVRQFLTNKIFSHQQREMLADSQTHVANGGDISPRSPLFSPKSPHSPLASPVMSRKAGFSASKDSPPTPQSPLFVRKFLSNVIEGELKKEGSSPPASQQRITGSDTNKKPSGDNLRIEDLEGPSKPSTELVNGDGVEHVGKVSGEALTPNSPKPVSGLVAHVNRDSSVPMTSNISRTSLRSMSESNILEKSDETQEKVAQGLQTSSHRTLSSPDLNTTVEQDDERTRKELSSSPAASPSNRSRFSSWFKRSSKHKTPDGDSPRYGSQSPKGKSRSVSPRNSGKITPLADSDMANSKSPPVNEDKKSHGLSSKLQNWLKKDGRKERSGSFHREDALDVGPPSGTPELLSYTRTTPSDVVVTPDLPSNLTPTPFDDKMEIVENGNSENGDVLGPEATVIKGRAVNKGSAPVQRQRRGSMYETRPPVLTRVKSPAASDSSRSSTPTKKPSTTTTTTGKSSLVDKSDKKMTTEKKSSVKKTSDTKTTIKKTDEKKRPSLKSSTTSKSASSIGQSSLSMTRTGSGSSVTSKKSVDSLKSSSVTSMKASSSTSLHSRTNVSSPAHGKSSPAYGKSSPAHGKASPFDRTPSAASNTSRTSGKSTPTHSVKSASGTKSTSSPVAGKSTSKTSTAKKSSTGSVLKNALKPSSTKTRSKSEDNSAMLKAKTSSQTSKSQKSKSTTSAPVKSKQSTATPSSTKPKTSETSASSKPATVSANKPPSGFSVFRRRTSYAIAMGEEPSPVKTKRKSSVKEVPAEVGPQPTPVPKSAPLKEDHKEEEEEERPLGAVAILDTLRRRHISENSVLNSVIEEEEEPESPVVSPTSRHRKSAPALVLQPKQKVIERSVGGTGRRRSVVTITPSQITQPSPAAKATPTKSTPTKTASKTTSRRHSAAPPTTKSATLDRSPARRRQSAFDLGSQSKSATLGARGRRQSAYQKRSADLPTQLDDSPPKGSVRRRKSSLEGIKDFLTSKVTRRRRTSSEGSQDNSDKQKSPVDGPTLAEFEEIGSSTSRLTHQSHKITVRPKMRRPPSTGHLRSLMDRDDVSSDIKEHKPPRRSNTMDSNAWSTYMGKKKMDPKAEAGLALKLDLNSVKLRKTVSLSLSEGNSTEGLDGANLGSVVEYSNPPVLLLHIKGRKHVQTVVVEPTASSLNSGDVFILVTARDLFHWVGSKANIMEKAKGTEIVERIYKKKDLGCKAVSFITLEDQKSERKANVFWEHLGGKQKPKAADQGFKDEDYEKNIPSSTIVYELQGEGDKAVYSVTRENTKQMPTISMLDSSKIFVFDFVTEVYLWVGKQSKVSSRKRAMILARELFDDGCFPSSFQRRPSTARRTSRGSIKLRRSSKGDLRSSMGKSRKGSATKGIAASVTGGTGTDKVKKPRPKWAIFNRLNEGSETILFREKFSDWPDPSRIIKMKGHVSSGETMELGPMPDPVPVDPKVFLNPQDPFKGLVLEGENVYRGKGRMRPDDVRGSKVTTTALKKWHIKEYDHTLMSEEDVGVFHSAEGYVIRWGFRAGVLRRLEGIHRGMSMPERPSKRPVTWHANSFPDILDQGDDVKNKDPFAVDSDDDEGKNQGPVTEGGGSERCAYFFWQGTDSSITEKGAAALMTVELDEERGPQIRVPQGEEVPAFTNLFDGGMIILDGSSEMNPLRISPSLKPCRLFAVRGNLKSEACLIEIPWKRNESMSSQLRSRGCCVLHHLSGNVVYLWHGSKATTLLQRAAKRCVVKLRRMFAGCEVKVIEEGSESDEFWDLLCGKEYVSLLNVSRNMEYTPRMWQLTSATGEFTANEVLCPSRSQEVEAFPFLQTDLYTVEQPALFMLDVHYDIYIWVGWWPVQTDARFREKNQFTGDAIVRFVRDKRLAIETALNYSKACGRIREPKVHVVVAGYEHMKFRNHFPYWTHRTSVATCNNDHVIIHSPHDLDAADELKKLSRDQYSLEELQKKPLPEGVDPKKLESYLSNEEFNNVFKMSKTDFSKIPLWKQTSLKKNAGLF